MGLTSTAIEMAEGEYINFLTVRPDGTPTGIDEPQARLLYLYGVIFTKSFWLDAPRFWPKISSGGLLLPDNEHILPQLSKSAADFYDKCQKNGIDSCLMFHPPSTEKKDVGYWPREVLITLGYAADSESTHLISFVRDSGVIKIPRSFIKQQLGTKDMKKASEQAQKNLEGIMAPGQIGPYPSGIVNPIIYFDEGQSLSYSREPVNLPTGHPNASITMLYGDVINVLRKVYHADVKILKILDGKE